MKIRVTYDLPVTFLKEDKMFVAHCLSLDLSTCGESYLEADANFKEAARLLLDECAKNGTLVEFLTSLGWTAKRTKKVIELSPPAYLGEQRISVSSPVLANN